MKNLCFLVIVVLAALGCNNSKKYSADKADKISLTDTYWQLFELNGQRVPGSVNNRGDIYLVIYASDKRVSGNAGCNRYSGSYTLDADGNNIRFSSLMHTEMACEDLEWENQFLRNMDRTDSYYLSDTILQLNAGKQTILAKFVAIKGKAIN